MVKYLNQLLVLYKRTHRACYRIGRKGSKVPGDDALQSRATSNNFMFKKRAQKTYTFFFLRFLLMREKRKRSHHPILHYFVKAPRFEQTHLVPLFFFVATTILYHYFRTEEGVPASEEK